LRDITHQQRNKQRPQHGNLARVGRHNPAQHHRHDHPRQHIDRADAQHGQQQLRAHQRQTPLLQLRQERQNRHKHGRHDVLKQQHADGEPPVRAVQLLALLENLHADRRAAEADNHPQRERLRQRVAQQPRPYHTHQHSQPDLRNPCS
jgi:hypothetical protein